MAMAIWLLMVMVVVVVVEVGVAQESSPLTPMGEPVTCTLPNTSMISPNYCNPYDEQRAGTETQACQGFLTELQAAPSVDCCAGLNDVASNRTACICKLTFYPPASHNASRQLALPALCGVTTNLCGQCPTFLVTRSNGTAPVTPVGGNGEADAPFSEGRSTASTAGAISLAVVFGLLLVGGIAAFSIILIKRRKTKNNPPEPFETPPPGGAF